MEYTEPEKKLMKQALAKHPGEILKFCGDKTNWKDCFIVQDVGGAEHLVFYYNLESGHTLTEISHIG